LFLFILAYFGGVLTIISPCILPVLPFVFARAGQPFLRSTLPMLIGMAGMFAAVATLAAVGGGWAVQANEYGRYIALVLLTGFGIILLLPNLSSYLTRPLVALGARLSQSADQSTQNDGPSVLSSLLLGFATGLLWAPCAGPVLGLILTGAALQGANVGTTLLLLAYALGAATSLALALLIGGKVFQTMKRSLGIGEWVKRGVGAAVLVSVGAIAMGLDTGFLTQASLASTNSIEQSLINRLNSKPAPSQETNGSLAMAATNQMMMAAKHSAVELPIEGQMPALDGAVQWLNSKPLSAQELRGKVVLVDFWTYSCINCLRALPYVEAWAQKYKDKGLVVIGVHAPEFAFEKNVDNVKKAIGDLGITYPVAIDNNYAIWRAFNNQYWPAHYFVDVQGRIRHHHFGEGDYDQSEQIIQRLLTEAGAQNVASGMVDVKATGAQAQADFSDVKSPETYVGYERAANFVSVGGIVKDMFHDYRPASVMLNEWGLTGNWTVGGENAVLNAAGGGLYYRFHARDLHLVLGLRSDSKPVRFRVTIDGKAPGDNHGADTDADGNGTVTGQRLYQLIRETGPVSDHSFEIKFLDPGVQAYAFTFG
jgi:cytochrome c biogenesis protein CcdA/thiol-disulfide isomerase/thioredoxin